MICQLCNRGTQIKIKRYTFHIFAKETRHNEVHPDIKTRYAIQYDILFVYFHTLAAAISLILKSLKFKTTLSARKVTIGPEFRTI